MLRLLGIILMGNKLFSQSKWEVLLLRLRRPRPRRSKAHINTSSLKQTVLMMDLLGCRNPKDQLKERKPVNHAKLETQGNPLEQNGKHTKRRTYHSDHGAHSASWAG